MKKPTKAMEKYQKRREFFDRTPSGKYQPPIKMDNWSFEGMREQRNQLLMAILEIVDSGLDVVPGVRKPITDAGRLATRIMNLPS